MKFFQKEADSAIRTGAVLLGGLGLGAALMYVLDPQRGKRRRALVRDKAVHAAHKTSDRLDARSRDLRNRAHGVAAEVKAVAGGEEVSDAVLEERVRAEIGRAVSNPGAIEVSAIGGTVMLSGAALTNELDELLSTVRDVRGVDDVENQLQVYETPGDVPALQGARGPRGKAERGRDRFKPAEAET
jgi:osmotically-inducible protein OsmY